MRDTAGMSERVAEIMGGEDGRRFFCKRDGRRTLGEAALGILVAASLLAGVVSFVALRTSSEEDPYGPPEETVERE